MNDDVKAQRGDELFDVVDASDRVIGQATRDQVHRERLWHRAVHAWVFSPAGEIFLQKRSQLKDTAPGCWDSSCSGHLDSGEDYDAAVVRELGEEIGLHLTHPPDRLFTVPARAETGWEFVWIYRLQHAGPFDLHPAEIESGAWVQPTAVDAALVTNPADDAPAFRLLWQHWRAGFART